MYNTQTMAQVFQALVQGSSRGWLWGRSSSGGRRIRSRVILFIRTGPHDPAVSATRVRCVSWLPDTHTT